jgi:GAF domain-containing protein
MTLTPSNDLDPADLLARLPSVNSMVGVPMVVGGRCRGAVLLGFHAQRPGELDLQLLATVAAQAAVASAAAELAKSVIRSPLNGVVTDIPIKLGEIISLNQKVIQI